jgi:hypothetical protein
LEDYIVKNKILALSLTFLMFSLSEAQGTVESYGSEVELPSVSTKASLSWTVDSANIELYEYGSWSGAAAWASPSTAVWGNDYRAGSYDSYDDASVEIPPGATTYAMSFGKTSNSNLFSASTVWLAPPSDTEYFARAGAQQFLTYEVTANGEIQYSVKYEIGFDSIGSEYEENMAWAWSYLESWNSTNGWEVIEGTFSELTSGSGTLDFRYYALAGSWIQLQFGVETHASLLNPNPVPVPPSVLMLLTGCTSLFFMRRRKN